MINWPIQSFTFKSNVFLSLNRMNHPSLKKKMILINPWLLSNGNLKKIKIILLIETLTFSSTMMASSGNNKFNDILEKQDLRKQFAYF